MTQGDSNLEWYYDYTTLANAPVGSYEVKYTAVIGGVTYYNYDYYDVTIADADSVTTDIAASEAKIDIIDTNVDSLIVDVAAVPTVEEIDTELTAEHGAGAWNAGAGSGVITITISLKDGSANDVEGVKASVHNAANNDTVIAGPFTTDASGDTSSINLDDATTYNIRMYKGGAVNETQSITTSGSATHELTVTVTTPTNPSDADLCRLRIYPITLSNVDITSLNIFISTTEKLTKVEGEFIKNTTGTFTYDSSTAPDSYYFDAVQTSPVKITCNELGLSDYKITVPETATKDLSDLIS
jgi:hypothetical protein